MPTELLKYRAYLLRLWRDGVETPWRASVEFPDGTEPKHFASLVAFCAFLEQQTGEVLWQREPRPSGEQRSSDAR